MKIDLKKVHDYQTVIDSKERTISDLKSKLRMNDSKTTSGIGMVMKSNLMKSDYLMNFRLNEHTDTVQLKQVLLQLIADTHCT